MVNVPSVPEIITVNSEALQSQIRDLLPSQNGFGSELQASNVITPVIDLTSTAEGAATPLELQEALSFNDITANFVTGASSTTVLNQVGFFLVDVVMTASNASGTPALNITDGSTTKTILQMAMGSNEVSTVFKRYTIFLTSGDSLIAVTNNTDAQINVVSRQIATGAGVLVNPTGFPV
tara:strand:+ start:227 stop:763 length:537 start_codon:yes stop_codon:yes gene_type:complete